MDDQNELIEKYMNSKLLFWMAVFAVIGPIAFIFYFPILFMLKAVLVPLGIKAKALVLTTWGLSFFCSFGVLRAGWKFYKS